MLNARNYARYSSTNQREESIEGQIRACNEYAARNGLNITGVYADRAISGRDADNRTQFQRMIRDAERGAFDVLLVYKLDRFARNRYDAAIYKARLSRAGVKIVSVMESIPDGAEGIILESVLDGFAEYYSANLAENVRRGSKETALAGKFNGGHTPYGFMIVDGKYTIDEPRAEIVREIFDRFAKGESYRQIYESLNARGYRTLNGKPFTRGSLLSMFQNEKYIGKFIYNVSDGDSIEVEGACPAIVSREVWDVIEARREITKGKPRLGKGINKYALSGKIFCPVCGQYFVGGVARKAGKPDYFYYRHSRKHGICDCENRHSRNREDIESRVFTAIKERVLNPESIEQIALAAESLQNEEVNAESAAAAAELKEVKSSIENIYRAIEQGIFSDGLKARLDELESRSVELSKAAAQVELSPDHLTADQIREYLNAFASGDFSDPDFQEKVISTFVKRVELDGDSVLVYMHYSAVPELESCSLFFGSHALAQLQKANSENEAGILIVT